MAAASSPSPPQQQTTSATTNGDSNPSSSSSSQVTITPMATKKKQLQPSIPQRKTSTSGTTTPAVNPLPWMNAAPTTPASIAQALQQRAAQLLAQRKAAAAAAAAAGGGGGGDVAVVAPAASTSTASPPSTNGTASSVNSTRSPSIAASSIETISAPRQTTAEPDPLTSVGTAILQPVTSPATKATSHRHTNSNVSAASAYSNDSSAVGSGGHNGGQEEDEDEAYAYYGQHAPKSVAQGGPSTASTSIEGHGTDVSPRAATKNAAAAASISVHTNSHQVDDDDEQEEMEDVPETPYDPSRDSVFGPAALYINSTDANADTDSSNDGNVNRPSPSRGNARARIPASSSMLTASSTYETALNSGSSSPLNASTESLSSSSFSPNSIRRKQRPATLQLADREETTPSGTPTSVPQSGTPMSASFGKQMGRPPPSPSHARAPPTMPPSEPLPPLPPPTPSTSTANGGPARMSSSGNLANSHSRMNSNQSAAGGNGSGGSSSGHGHGQAHMRQTSEPLATSVGLSGLGLVGAGVPSSSSSSGGTSSARASMHAPSTVTRAPRADRERDTAAAAAAARAAVASARAQTEAGTRSAQAVLKGLEQPTFDEQQLERERAVGVPHDEVTDLSDDEMGEEDEEGYEDPDAQMDLDDLDGEEAVFVGQAVVQHARSASTLQTSAPTLVRGASIRRRDGSVGQSAAPSSAGLAIAAAAAAATPTTTTTSDGEIDISTLPPAVPRPVRVRKLSDGSADAARGSILIASAPPYPVAVDLVSGVGRGASSSTSSSGDSVGAGPLPVAAEGVKMGHTQQPRKVVLEGASDEEVEAGADDGHGEPVSTKAAVAAAAAAVAAAGAGTAAAKHPAPAPASASAGGMQRTASGRRVSVVAPTGDWSTGNSPETKLSSLPADGTAPTVSAPSAAAAAAAASSTVRLSPPTLAVTSSSPNAPQSQRQQQQQQGTTSPSQPFTRRGSTTSELSAPSAHGGPGAPPLRRFSSTASISDRRAEMEEDTKTRGAGTLSVPPQEALKRAEGRFTGAFGETVKAFRALQAEKRALEAVVRATTPLEGVGDGEGLGKYLTSVGDKLRNSASEISQLLELVDQQRAVMDYILTTHEEDTERLMAELDTTEDALDQAAQETEAHRAAAEKLEAQLAAAHAEGVQARAETLKVRALLEEETAKRERAFALAQSRMETIEELEAGAGAGAVAGELKKTREEAEKREAALQAQLDEHKGARDELEEHRVRVGTLQSELEQHRSRADGLAKDLETHKASLLERTTDSTNAQAQLEQLYAQLEDRVIAASNANDRADQLGAEMERLRKEVSAEREGIQERIADGNRIAEARLREMADAAEARERAAVAQKEEWDVVETTQRAETDKLREELASVKKALEAAYTDMNSSGYSLTRELVDLRSKLEAKDVEIAQLRSGTGPGGRTPRMSGAFRSISNSGLFAAANAAAAATTATPSAPANATVAPVTAAVDQPALTAEPEERDVEEHMSDPRSESPDNALRMRSDSQPDSILGDDKSPPLRPTSTSVSSSMSKFDEADRASLLAQLAEQRTRENQIRTAYRQLRDELRKMQTAQAADRSKGGRPSGFLAGTPGGVVSPSASNSRMSIESAPHGESNVSPSSMRGDVPPPSGNGITRQLKRLSLPLSNKTSRPASASASPATVTMSIASPAGTWNDMYHGMMSPSGSLNGNGNGSSSAPSYPPRSYRNPSLSRNPSLNTGDSDKRRSIGYGTQGHGYGGGSNGGSSMGNALEDGASNGERSEGGSDEAAREEEIDVVGA